MKELVLTTIGNIQYEALNTIFSDHGVNIIERKNKQPETQELLFYCSPETYLATYSSGSTEQPSALLKKWMHETKKQLEHVIANPEGCWLVDLDYAATNPGEFIHFAQESLDVDLIECLVTTVDVLTLAKQGIMLVENDTVQEVYEDIIAASDYFNPAQSVTALDRITQYFNRLEVEKERTHKVQIETDELKIINGKLQLTLDDITSENELTVLQITQLQEELDSVNRENKLALLQVTQLEKELEASTLNNAVLQSENKKLTSEENKLKDECEKFNLVNVKQQAELESVKSENELALLQVAQLQEELEAIFSNNAVLQGENKKLITKENKFKKEVEQLSQVNKKQQTELAMITSNNTVLQGENELALLQVAQLQEELKVLLSNNAVLQGENKKLTSEENKLKKEMEQLGQVNKKQQAELDDTKSENELALLQIAQLQEELEFYFIKSQTANTVELRTTLPRLTISTLKESLQLSKLLSFN